MGHLKLLGVVAVAALLSACATYGDPVGQSFLFCDREAEACYRSCESRVGETAYVRCQENCGIRANQCFRAADAQSVRYSSVIRYRDPWFGPYGAWYPS
ncbi:MAG: hypothetical protein AAGH38_05325, partial [Pseudomonadota bacterium]